jgi:AcrR family transcriptional regulator
MPPTSRTRRRQRLSPAERRAAIEEAAARLFAERGSTATTLDDIAAAAGITKPMIYRHFESKQELELALLAKHRDQLAQAALAEYDAQGPLEARLPAMIDAWFAYVERHPHGARMLLRDAAGDPEIEGFQQELRAMQRAADIALIKEHDASIAESQLEPLAEVIRSSLTGLGLWWLERPGVPRSAPVEAMLRVVQGLLAVHDAEGARAKEPTEGPSRAVTR